MDSVNYSNLTPADLGLPFASFRSHQTETIEKLMASKKKFLLLQAPTGAGKTLLACAFQRLTKAKALYVPVTKSLQAQFMSDFSRLSNKTPYASELKGRQNYPTRLYPKRFPHIHTGLCTKKRERHCRWCCRGDCGGDDKCLAEKDCLYERAKKQALASQVACVNTSLLLTEANFVGRFSGWELVVLDEADCLEGELMGFIEISISGRLIERLHLTPPRFKTKEEAWIDWIGNQALPRLSSRLLELQSAYGVQELREEEELQRLEHKLQFALREIPQAKWVLQAEDWERGPWAFKPVFVSRYADHQLWRHGKKFLLMSATILSPQQMVRDLGIPEGEWDFVDLPSNFPASRRPIFALNGPNINYKNEAVSRPATIRLLDKVLARHTSDRVLVHTVSYSLSQIILNTSKHKERMLSYSSSSGRQGALDKFRNGPADAILVACSMTRGLDLAYGAARCAVIVKVPYPSLGDNQVSARLYASKVGRSWYAVNTVREIVQASGRVMRAVDDYATTYILDGEFSRLYKEWKFLFPEWWRAALRKPPVGLTDEEGVMK